MPWPQSAAEGKLKIAAKGARQDGEAAGSPTFVRGEGDNRRSIEFLVSASEVSQSEDELRLRVASPDATGLGLAIQVWNTYVQGVLRRPTAQSAGLASSFVTGVTAPSPATTFVPTGIFQLKSTDDIAVASHVLDS
jgi:hypothetical protein